MIVQNRSRLNSLRDRLFHLAKLLTALACVILIAISMTAHSLDEAHVRVAGAEIPGGLVHLQITEDVRGLLELRNEEGSNSWQIEMY